MRDLVRRCRGRLLSRKLSVGQRCYRCRMPWTRAEAHLTTFNGFRGIHSCFPLCELCWERLNPETRWRFYAAMILDWQVNATDPRQSMRVEDESRSIFNAVKRGL